MSIALDISGLRDPMQFADVKSRIDALSDRWSPQLGLGTLKRGFSITGTPFYVGAVTKPRIDMETAAHLTALAHAQRAAALGLSAADEAKLEQLEARAAAAFAKLGVAA